MPNKLAHFAIEADDLERARLFYEAVFGWRFKAWGPQDFFMIEGAGVLGALQKRREPMPSGRKGIECSFAVDDLDDTAKRIETAGGTLTGETYAIPMVGELRPFRDTEGNEAIVIQYLPEKLAEMGFDRDLTDD